MITETIHEAYPEQHTEYVHPTSEMMNNSPLLQWISTILSSIQKQENHKHSCARNTTSNFKKHLSTVHKNVVLVAKEMAT